jgi:hypothetical protein
MVKLLTLKSNRERTIYGDSKEPGESKTSSQSERPETKEEPQGRKRPSVGIAHRPVKQRKYGSHNMRSLAVAYSILAGLNSASFASINANVANFSERRPWVAASTGLLQVPSPLQPRHGYLGPVVFSPHWRSLSLTNKCLAPRADSEMLAKPATKCSGDWVTT